MKNFLFILSIIVYNSSYSQQFVNGNLDSKEGWKSITLNANFYIIASEEYHTNAIKNNPLDTSCFQQFKTLGHFIQGIEGFDTLAFKGQGGEIDFDYDRPTVAKGDTTFFLRADANSDTMRNFGWSLSLNNILENKLTYQINVSMSNYHYYIDTLGPLTYDFKMWYLRIGQSKSPNIEGDSIGVISNDNFIQEDIFGYFINVPGSKIKHKKFSNLITGNGNGNFLTFRIVSIADPKHLNTPYMPRNIFSCQQWGVYRKVILLDNFELKCITNVVKVGDSCLNGSPVLLQTNASNVKYLWSTMDTTASIIVTKPGKYWVQTNSAGCIGSDTILVGLQHVSQGFLGPDKTVCEGEVFEMGLNPISKTALYKWETGETTNSINASKKGNYVLKILDSGCVAQDTIVVNYFPRHIAIDTTKFDFCEDSVYTINSNFTDTKWYRNDILIYEGNPLVYSSKSAEKLFLNTTVSCEQWDTINIVVRDCGPNIIPKVFIENAFSPDNNGVNDVFSPSLRNWKLVSLEVFNRWGEKVYSGTTGWDGNSNGQPCQDGVYIYKSVYEHLYLQDVKDFVNTGYVTLLR